jgi:hypothetical protein
MGRGSRAWHKTAVLQGPSDEHGASIKDVLFSGQDGRF